MKGQGQQRTAHASNAPFEISELYQELERDADPRHSIARIRDRISAFKRAGREVPEGLVDIARQLETECAATSQGR